MRIAPRVVLNVEDRDWLETLSRSRTEAVRLSERALIVLLAADGLTNREIGLSLGITEEKTARWRGRFLAQGRAGLEKDAPGRGRKPTYPPEIVAAMLNAGVKSSLTSVPSPVARFMVALLSTTLKVSSASSSKSAKNTRCASLHNN